MITLIDKEEAVKNKTYPLSESNIAALDKLKEKTNSKTWDKLFTKLIHVLDSELNKRGRK